MPVRAQTIVGSIFALSSIAIRRRSDVRSSAHINA